MKCHAIRCVPRWFWGIYLLCFGGAGWIGHHLYRRPVAVPPAVSVTLIFHVYDVHGNQLSQAKLMGPKPTVAPQVVQGSECQLTQPQGSRLSLAFAYGSQQKEEAVVWRSLQDYSGWLDNEFPAALQAMDSAYDRQRWQEVIQRIKARARPTKYDYPVVFPVTR